MFMFSFLKALKYELGYLPDFNKYKHLLELVENQEISYTTNHELLLRYCKILFMQDFKDKKKFEIIFKKCIELEEQNIGRWLDQRNEVPPNDEEEKRDPNNSQSLEEENLQDKKEEEPPQEDSQIDEPQNLQTLIPSEDESETDPSPSHVFYYPNLFHEDSGYNTVDVYADQFNEEFSWRNSDEYFPITRRKMIQGWKYIRLKSDGKRTDQIDIAATISKIAEEKIITEPSYSIERVNRNNSLVIFIDYGGSMMPFAELSQRLIETATIDGGQGDATIFYFHNYPIRYLYSDSDQSTISLELSQLKYRLSSKYSLALVFSDAGAARGYLNEKRVNATCKFLEELSSITMNMVWLNPMPRNRWKNTTAEQILENCAFLNMFSMMDDVENNFQQLIHNLFSKRPVYR